MFFCIGTIISWLIVATVSVIAAPPLQFGYTGHGPLKREAGMISNNGHYASSAGGGEGIPAPSPHIRR